MASPLSNYPASEVPRAVDIELTEEQWALLRELRLRDSQFAQGIEDDWALSQRLCEIIKQMIAKMDAGGTVTADEMMTAINEAAASAGCEYGIPTPSIQSGEVRYDPNLVLAPRVPLRHTVALHQAARTETEEELRRNRVTVRNSWDRLGDQTVCVIDTDEGPMALPRWHAGQRLRKLLNTIITRSGTQLKAAAELRAMDNLKPKLSERQWDSYVLNGAFPEHSKRSDIHYVFRKGYPTLAVSYHGQGNLGGKILAALCLHPMGYYQGTHCGLMAPSDEVIAHLLMMRADERKYWAKSGQWNSIDSRSGI